MQLFRNAVVSISLAYFGAVVGAGFISGQELAQFFLQFGALGLVGWFITTIAIVLGGGCAIGFLAKKKYPSYDHFVNELFGKLMAPVANLISLGYLFGGLVIMVSGAGSLAAEIMNTGLVGGVLAVSIAILLTIIGKSERMLKVNSFLVPILIVLALITSAIIWTKVEVGTENITSAGLKVLNPSAFLLNWWIAVPLYLGYNTIGAIVGFINIAKTVDEKDGALGGFLGGFLVAAVGSIIMATMIFAYPSWQSSEIPLVTTIQQYASEIYPLFAPAMLIAMFTVATNYSLGISDYLKENYLKQANQRYISVSLLLIVAPVALLGFSTLLGTIYPVFGILATVLMIWLVARSIQQKLKSITLTRSANPE